MTGILLAALLLGSCVKSSGPAKAASGPSGGGKPSVAAPAPSAQPPQPAQPAPQQPAAKPLTLTREPAAPASAAVVKRDRGLLALYSLDPRRTAFPEDFRIGPLSGAGVAGLSADDAEVLRTAASLLSELSKKKIADALLQPDRKDALSRFLGDAVAGGYVPLLFRLGSVNRTADSQVRVNVRLLGPTGSAEGELFFGKEGNRWLIADIQIRFRSLAEKRPPSQERYYPATYRWLLDDF